MVGDRRVPEGRRPGVQAVQVEAGEDAADRYIRDRVEPQDLVVTRDLPFAEALTERGLTVLNDQGDVYTAENIAERRSIRDFMYEYKQTAGAPPRSRGPRELQAFANAFDRELTKRLNRS
jgi:hypothetical protein